MLHFFESNERALRVGVGLFLLLASCGKTAKPGAEGLMADAGAAGADGMEAGRGGGGSSPGGAGTSPGNPGGAAGAVGGSAAATGGASEGGASAELCVEGAACRCKELVGTLHCDEGSEGVCSCPAAEVCEGKPRSCFEPCGGDPTGVWVLQQTCFPATSDGLGCPGAFLDAAPSADSLRLQILEGEPLAAKGDEGLDVTARVPLSCLGIESVARCSGADFYVAPLLYTLSRPLACEANDCGHCECSAQLSAYAGYGYAGLGPAWKPGAATLSFGQMEVPFCAKGDTLWAGGSSADGTPKVAYEFRRQSCVGTPLPCAERPQDECSSGGVGDCTPGRCVVTAGGDAATCADFAADQDQCATTSGCRWDPQGCWGTAAEACDFINCDGTPGCSWGPPKARCGGRPTSCYDRELATCSETPGCSPRTCYLEAQDDTVSCEPLEMAACSKTTGCTWSGARCTGVTHCSQQKDPDACNTLQCFPSSETICGGYPTQLCADLSVDDCRTVLGCRLEW